VKFEWNSLINIIPPIGKRYRSLVPVDEKGEMVVNAPLRGFP